MFQKSALIALGLSGKVSKTSSWKILRIWKMQIANQLLGHWNHIESLPDSSRCYNSSDYGLCPCRFHPFAITSLLETEQNVSYMYEYVMVPFTCF